MFKCGDGRRAVPAALCAILTLALSASMVMGDAARPTPWLAGVTTNGVYVSLEATDTSTATVYYGLTAGYGSTVTTESTQAAGSNYVHNIKLTGLAANTQYHYKVTQGASDSGDFTFYTAPAAGTNGTWGFAADSRTDPTWHNTMAGLIDSHAPRMMVYGGDLCASPTYASWNNEWFVSNQNTLNARAPFVNAPGNHEDWNNLTKAFTQSSGGDPDYHSFDYGDAHIVVINNEISDSPASAQATWVAADLAASSAKWKIVALHKPAYSYGAHGGNADMQSMTNNIFELEGVDFVLGGHNHFYQHNLLDGIHHMTIGSFGVSPGSPSSGAGTIYSESTMSFGIFDMTPNTLTLRTYRQNGSLIETIVVPEPATMLLLAAGGIGLVLRRRRR